MSKVKERMEKGEGKRMRKKAEGEKKGDIIMLLA